MAALLTAGLVAAYLTAFAGGKLLLAGFGAVFAVIGVLIAGYNIYAMLLGLLAVRTSLDWFVAARSGGGGTPVTGLQPALLVGGAALIAAVAWLVVQWAGSTFRRPSPIGLALSGFAFVCVVTSLGAGNPLVSLSTSFRVLIGASMFLMVEQLLMQKPDRYKALLVAIGVSVLIPAAMSVFQFAHRTPVKNYVTGPFVHQNTMAIWLSVLIPVFAALIRYTRQRTRLACILLTVGGSVMLLFTYCRSAWIGLVAALLVLAVLQERKLLIAMVIVIASIWAWVPSVQERLSDLDDVRVEGMGDPNSLAFRQRYWQELLAEHVDGVPLIQNVTGIGLGMVEETHESQLEPHNVWVQVVVETGALGTISFIVLVGAITLQFARGIRRAKPGFQRALIIGVAAGAFNMLVQSLSQNLITEAVIWTYFATMLAIASVMTMVNTRGLLVTAPDDPSLDPVAYQPVRPAAGAPAPVPVLAGTPASN